MADFHEPPSPEVSSSCRGPLPLTEAIRSNVAAPAVRRIVQKLAASMVLVRRATRAKTEFAAKAAIARAVRTAVLVELELVIRGGILHPCCLQAPTLPWVDYDTSFRGSCAVLA